MSWDTLVGYRIQSGWIVKAMRAKAPGDTGGHFSVCFVVEKDGRQAFMKAFDLQRLFFSGMADPQKLQQELESINFENKLLEMCREAGAKAVVVPVETGSFVFAGLNADQPIQYLIFDLAKEDVRRYHTYRPSIDYLVNLEILKQVARGLLELHQLEIAHQDLKPSNVLLFADGAKKVADLGRSSLAREAVWHDAYTFAGDSTYAPIEVLYRRTEPNWYIRRLAGDLYMLGSLTLFLFTSVNLTAQLVGNTAPAHQPGNWADSYDDVVPYLRDALRVTLGGHQCFQSGTGAEVQALIRELCDPDPRLRGSSRIQGFPQRYSLQRYFSQFERMAMQVRLRGTVA